MTAPARHPAVIEYILPEHPVARDAPPRADKKPEPSGQAKTPRGG